MSGNALALVAAVVVLVAILGSAGWMTWAVSRIVSDLWRGERLDAADWYVAPWRTDNGTSDTTRAKAG